METNRSGDLDAIARWRVIRLKKARAQNAFVKWRNRFRGGQSVSLANVASWRCCPHSGAPMIAESKNYNR